MAYACKTSSAKNIVGVIPYLPYCKQCKLRYVRLIENYILISLFECEIILRLLFTCS